MDMFKIGRDNVRIQKKFFGNLFENLNLFHNYLEKAHNYCAHHIGANSQLQAAFNNNWMALKKNRDEIRKMTDESLTNMESYFDRINSKPTE
jgi:hypothetical protein